jgi:hypothetical protein
MNPAAHNPAHTFANAVAQAHGGKAPTQNLNNSYPSLAPIAKHGGFGLPADRHARLAARRAFVALKRSYLHVMEDVPGQALLRAQICRAEDPDDLWALRAPVFAALDGSSAEARGRRQLLHRGLDSMFSSLQDSAYGPGDSVT